MSACVCVCMFVCVFTKQSSYSTWVGLIWMDVYEEVKLWPFKVMCIAANPAEFFVIIRK